jgi:hypothetical protein
MPDAPSPPYVGPPAHFSAGTNRPPVNRIVIHATVSPCVPGGARSIGAYFRSAAAGGSAQYIVDPEETVQAAWDNVICWGAPPNQHSLHVELCDPQTGPGSRWKDTAHTAMLLQAAHLVAGLGAAYDVPLRKIGPADLIAGRRGICGHVDVSNAWRETDHTDPGPDFPWDDFMKLVHVSGGIPAPPPPPTTPSHGGNHRHQTPAMKTAVKDLRVLNTRRPNQFGWLTAVIRRITGK